RQQRGLAASRCPDEADELAVGDRQRQAVYRVHCTLAAAIDLGDLREADGGARGAPGAGSLAVEQGLRRGIRGRAVPLQHVHELTCGWPAALSCAFSGPRSYRLGRFCTGVSRPTDTACCASAASEDEIGSLVKVMALNDADRTPGSRPLPSSLVSSAL